MEHVTPAPTQPTFGKVMGALLWSYVGPCIFNVGIVGNILILVTMAQRRMRGTSTCVYLQCMAAADLAVLLTGMIPEWLEARSIVIVKVNTTTTTTTVIMITNLTCHKPSSAKTRYRI